MCGMSDKVPDPSTPSLTRLRRAAKTITATLFVAQSLGSAATITGATIASIIGAELSGRTSLAGLPGSVTQLGGAASALLWSLVSERLGRRLGLAFGVMTGALGGLFASLAVVQGSFYLLLVSLIIMSSARASLNLGRFAAAEVTPPVSRGRAVAFVVLGGTVGSVVGPFLVEASSAVARDAGFNALAGPYAAIAVLFALAAVALVLFLRPDPKVLALEVAEAYPQPELDALQARPLKTLLQQPGIAAAVSAMVLGYAVMTLLMGITSLHMLQNAHTLTAISLVFSAHTLGMFGFSVLTGWLIDRWGRRPVIVSGALMLIAACVVAPLSLAFWPLALALFLLGLGWNFCYVGGSTLLSDHLSPLEKARTQGVNDMTIGLASACASALSGYLLATIGYDGMGFLGAGLSALLLVVMVQYKPTKGHLLPAVGD